MGRQRDEITLALRSTICYLGHNHMGRTGRKGERTTYFSMKIAPELKAMLRAEARAQERPLSQLVEIYIRYGLGIRKLPKPTMIPGNGDAQ